MSDLNGIIAENLRQLRHDRKLSLDKLAEITGVSKSMLGQIERGESNPTITTIWKIAAGLKVSFTALVNAPQSDTVIVDQAAVVPLAEAGGKYRVYPIFPYEEGRRFEVYSLEIDPGGTFASNPHGEKTQEFITVFAGELTIVTNSREYRLKTGQSIRFRADNPHSYHNPGNVTARLSMVIYYP
ncbi:MAG: XRE family transcriptional regulator [Negativicutes bacterium]|nr:XRE family transcriptional regulator [Negativicutes bacterium]